VFRGCLKRTVAEQSQLHSNRSIWGLHLDPMPLELSSLGNGSANSEGTRLGQEELAESVRFVGLDQEREQDARTLLFHLDRGVEGIQGSQSQGLFQHSPEHLGGEIIDVALQYRDGVRLPVGLWGCVGPLPKNRPQDIGPESVVPGSQTVAYPGTDNAGHRAEGFSEFSEDRRACWGDHLVGFFALGDRDGSCTEDLERRRSGQWHAPVGAADEACAFHNGAGTHAGTSQLIHREAGPDNVDDRINGAHLVELHFGRIQAVDLSFRDRNPLEDRQGASPNPIREGALFEQASDLRVASAVNVVGPVPVAVVMSVVSAGFVRMRVLVGMPFAWRAGIGGEMDIKLRPVDGSLHPAGHVQVVPLDGQALEILGQDPWIHPKVEEGRDEHVAGDARTEVEVEVFHGQVGVEGRTRALMALAAYPAPNPLSMLTTVRPLAQEFSMPSSAVSPPI
jgi:hypothetical protein